MLRLAPADAAPLFLVVPGDQADSPGNKADEAGRSGSHHFQYMIGPARFNAVSGDILITQLAIRTALGTGPVSIVTSSMQVRLSSSPYFPKSNGGALLLTDTFANNFGPDTTVVYSGGLNLASNGCAVGSVCPFDLVLTFTTPFLFNFSRGRLLFDFQTPNAIQSGFLDAVTFSFPPGGSLASLNGPYLATAGEVDTQGGGDPNRLCSGNTGAGNPHDVSQWRRGPAALALQAERRQGSVTRTPTSLLRDGNKRGHVQGRPRAVVSRQTASS